MLVERDVRSGDELRASLRTLKPGEVDALFPMADATVQSNVALIIEEAQTRKLPAIFNDESLVAAAGWRATGRATTRWVDSPPSM